MEKQSAEQNPQKAPYVNPDSKSALPAPAAEKIDHATMHNRLPNGIEAFWYLLDGGSNGYMVIYAGTTEKENDGMPKERQPHIEPAGRYGYAKQGRTSFYEMMRVYNKIAAMTEKEVLDLIEEGRWFRRNLKIKGINLPFRNLNGQEPTVEEIAKESAALAANSFHGGLEVGPSNAESRVFQGNRNLKYQRPTSSIRAFISGLTAGII